MKVRANGSTAPRERAPGRHDWTLMLQYPITDGQAVAYVDGAAVEVDLEHPVAGVVVCGACEEAWAFVKGTPCTPAQ